MSAFYEYLNSLASSITPSKDLDYYQKIYGDTPFSVGNFTDNDARSMWGRYGVDSDELLNYVNSITDATTQNRLYDLIDDRSTFSGYDPYNQNYQNTLNGLIEGTDTTWKTVDTSGDQWKGVPTELLSDIYGGYLKDGSLYLPGDADLNSRLLMNPDKGTVELIKQFQNVAQASGSTSPYYSVVSHDQDFFNYLPAEYVASGANKDGRGWNSLDTAYIVANPELYANNFREISTGMNDMGETLGPWTGIDNPQKGYLLGANDIRNGSDTVDQYMVGRNSNNLMLDNDYDPAENGGLRPQIWLDGNSSKYDVQVDSNGKWRRAGRDGGSGEALGWQQHGLSGISGDTKMGDLDSSIRGTTSWDNDTGSVLGKFGGIVGSLLAFTPLAPLGYALQMASAIENKNLLQGIGAAVGASGVLKGLGGIGDSFAAADAAQLANQGLSNAAIAQNLGQAYNMGSLASNTLAGLTSIGVTDPLYQSIATGGLTGGINAGLSGNDLGQGVLAGITGSAVGNAINSVPIGTSGNILIDAGVSGAKGGLTNALTNTIVGNDADIGASMLSGAINGVTRNAFGQVWNAAKGLFENDAETPTQADASNNSGNTETSFLGSQTEDYALQDLMNGGNAVDGYLGTAFTQAQNSQDTSAEIPYTAPNEGATTMYGDTLDNYLNNLFPSDTGSEYDFSGWDSGLFPNYDALFGENSDIWNFGTDPDMVMGGPTPWDNLPPSGMPLEPVDWSVTNPGDLPWVDAESSTGANINDLLGIALGGIGATGGTSTPGTSTGGTTGGAANPSGTTGGIGGVLSSIFGSNTSMKDVLPWLLGGTALAGALTDNEPTTTTSTVTSTPTVPDWYSQAQQTMAGNISAMPVVAPQYTQPLAAGISQNEQSGVDMADSVTGAWAPQFANAVNQATRTATSIPETDLTQYMNPYMAEVLAPTLRTVNQNFDSSMNKLNDAAASRGSFGGSRNSLLMGLNEENRARALGEETSKGFSNAFNYATDTALKDRASLLDTANSLGSMAGDYQRMLSGDVNQLMSTGAAARGINDNLYNKQYADYLSQLKYPLDAIGAYSGALSSVAPKVYGSTATTTATGAAPNMWSNLLGMGATGVSLYNQLFPSTPATTPAASTFSNTPGSTNYGPTQPTTVGDVGISYTTPNYSLT